MASDHSTNLRRAHASQTRSCATPHGGTGSAPRIHDLLAIGCGPFNLGLAALATRAPDLDLVVLEQAPELRWHPGLHFEHGRLQVSFLADLVSLIDPTHPLSFLAYLRAVDRLYLFYVREDFHPPRREYEDYLRWVGGQLDSIRFQHRVDSVRWDARGACFFVDTSVGGRTRASFAARNLVLGTGTEPWIPPALAQLGEARVIAAGAYRDRERELAGATDVTVVGSGQSGAEIVVELLQRNPVGGGALRWITRTPSFAPLDYTKLVLEMTTPDYMRYFHGLDAETRHRLVREQWRHYKGISSETLDQIHDQLYRRELLQVGAPVELRCGTSIEAATLDAEDRVLLTCLHHDTSRRFVLKTDRVVAATGYRLRQPVFLEPIAHLLEAESHDCYRIRLDHSLAADSSVEGRIFVAHADLHSHGVAAPDLGVAAYRNATILNQVLKRELYPLPRRTGFTRFAPPDAEICPSLQVPSGPSASSREGLRPCGGEALHEGAR